MSVSMPQSHGLHSSKLFTYLRRTLCTEHNSSWATWDPHRLHADTLHRLLQQVQNKETLTHCRLVCHKETLVTTIISKILRFLGDEYKCLGEFCGIQQQTSTFQSSMPEERRDQDKKHERQRHQKRTCWV